MKKIFLATMITFSSVAPVALIAQESNYSLINEKKDLRHEKREITKEEKNFRKEDRASRSPEVNYNTKQEFALDFPGASNIYFHEGKNFDEADYTLGGRVYTAFYDANATLVGTTTVTGLNQLPAKAQRELKKRYTDKGYSIDKIILYDDNENSSADMWLYEQPFEDEDNYFVEVSKADKKMVLEVSMRGDVAYFKNLR